MYADRKKLYAKLAKSRKSQVLAYITGDRGGLETQIAGDVVPLFGDLLDHYEGATKISLFLYTNGGDTLAGWSLINLIREFCDELEIIIPSRCQSTGTLMCLGANSIVMAKQATLGPIDPSVNTPLNPQIPGAPPTSRMPVSVEDIAGFIEMAHDEGGIISEDNLSKVFMKLADNVHPMALGRVSRARSQIKELARKLLELHMDDKEKVEKIIKTLCVEAGSHDYTIYRTEAREHLKLEIDTPSMPLYNTMKDIHLDYRSELKIDEPFKPGIGLNVGESEQYDLVRAMIETQDNGAYHLTRKGTIEKKDLNGQVAITDNLEFDGWELKQ